MNKKVKKNICYKKCKYRLKFGINHVIDHRHVIFVLAVVKVAKRDVTAVRSLAPVRPGSL